MNAKTNETPHSRLFCFNRKFHGSVGGHVPKWLSSSKKVLFNDVDTDPPLAQEVQLVHSNSDSAHIKLPDGKDFKAKTENLYPVLNGVKENLQNLDLVELTSETDSVFDAYDSDSDILCLNEAAPTYPLVKCDPNSTATSSQRASIASEPQNSINGDIFPTSTVPIPMVQSADSPPHTRSRTLLEDMVLRSGRVLPRK